MNESPPVSPEPDERSAWSLTTMLAVTGLTVVVILAVVSTFILMGDDDTPETSAPPPQRSGTAEPNPPEDLDGKFDIPTVDIRGREVAVPKNPWGQVLPQTGKPSGGDGPPDGLMWQRVVAIPMPFSTSAGPTRISATGVPSGFSRTPDGAVLAAWQLGWRLAAGPREMREALMASSVQFSPDYAATQRAAYDELPDSFGPTELRGFDNIPDYINVASYSQDLATVKYGVEAPASSSSPAQPGGAVFTFTVVWHGGAWNLALQGVTGAIEASVTDVAFADADGWSQW